MSDRIEAAEAILATCAAARGRISSIAHAQLPFGRALALELVARVGQSPEREAIVAWQEMLALETRIWRGPSAGELSVGMPSELPEPTRKWVPEAPSRTSRRVPSDVPGVPEPDVSEGAAAAREPTEEEPLAAAAEPQEDRAAAPSDVGFESSLPVLDDDTEESGEQAATVRRSEPQPEADPEPAALEATQPDGGPAGDVDESAFDLQAMSPGGDDESDSGDGSEQRAIAQLISDAGDLPSSDEIDALVAELEADALDDDDLSDPEGAALEDGPHSLAPDDLEDLEDLEVLDDEETPEPISLSLSVPPEDSTGPDEDDEALPSGTPPPPMTDGDVATRTRGLGAALAASLAGVAAKAPVPPARQREPQPRSTVDNRRAIETSGGTVARGGEEETVIPEVEESRGDGPHTLPPAALQPLDAAEQAPELSDDALEEFGDLDDDGFDLPELPSPGLGAPQAAAAAVVVAVATAESLALGDSGEALVDDEDDEDSLPEVAGGGFSVHFERPEDAGDGDSGQDHGPRLTDDADMSLASTTGPAAAEATTGVADAYDPTDLDRFRALAKQAEELGDLQAAILHYSDMLDLESNTIEGYIGRGRAQMELGDFAAALSDFQRAEDLRPESPEPMVEMGHLFFARKDYTRAIELYDHAIEIDPSHAMARCRRGISHHYRRDHRKAFQDLQRAYALDPEIPNIRKYVQMAVKAMERTDR